MRKIVEFLGVEKQNISLKYLVALALLAYLFAVVARLVWVYQFGGSEQSYWDGVLMINTNDGYFFAEGARDLLGMGHMDEQTVLQPLAYLTALLQRLNPFSFESLLLYMPTIFGSLLVLPTLLTGRAIGLGGVGFVGALIAGIAWSYYNRTMTGYYDSDLLIVVLPTFAVWAYIYAFVKKDYRLLPLAPILAILASSWHHGGMQIANAMFFVSIFYVLVFERREKFNYKLITIFALSMFALPIYIKLIGILALSYAFYYFKEKIDNKTMMAIMVLAALLYMIFGGFSWIMGVLGSSYLVRALVADEINMSLKFYEVVNTVREAGHIDFTTFANRISGHTYLFFLSLIGYVMMLIRYPIMLLSLPMVALGFFALQGGLRFTVFAVPFMALGFAYFIFWVGKFVPPSMPRIGFLALATAGALYPNIMHIVDYRVPTVFNKQEVQILDELKKVSSRSDYVLSWWDYGYPIRYYGDMKTLVDGGKHDGSANYPVSFLLTYPNQVASANMARLNVETNEKFYKEKLSGNQVEYMVKSYGFKSPNELISALGSKELKLPPKTSDIYYYLPFRMMEIFPTVKVFSNMDVTTGRVYQSPFFYYAQNFKDDGKTIQLGNGITITKEGSKINIGGNQLQLKDFYVTAYDQNGKLTVNKQSINPNSSISVIFMQSYGGFLVVDDDVLNSPYIQLFVLENYDRELFEPINLNPLAKVYKLKK